MALSNEDKKDVQGAMGKALANKVSKVTRDKVTYSGSANKKGGVDYKVGGKVYNASFSPKSKALQGKKTAARVKDIDLMRDHTRIKDKYGLKD